MFHIIIYLLISYACVGVLAVIAALVMRRLPEENVIRRKAWLHLSSFFLLAILPLIPYIKVEYQTALFKSILLPVTQQALHEIGGSKERILSVKVLSMGRSQAKMYVLTRGMSTPPMSVLSGSGKLEPCFSGIVVDLVKTAAGWEFQGDWDAVWSDCGSADGNTFPPYFSKGEYKD